jgi:protein arginine N-methyltransferase 1
MYSVSGFGEMMLDTVRMEAYVRALRNVVRPNSVVLDIGTGTGIFAILAHKFGARRVIAVEPNDAIHVAREIAIANNCSDAIEFHQNFSTQLNLSEPADVILSDLRGVLPHYEQHIPTIVDARARLLAPGGVMISQRDDLWISVIEAENAYRSISGPWIENFYDLDMRAGARLMVNRWTRIAATASQLLAEPVHAGTFDYQTIESPDFSVEVDLLVLRDGIAHGLCVWFDATLAEGIGFSNAPGLPDAVRPIYRNAFFPFVSPVALSTNDTLKATLKADLIGGDYVWRWHTIVWGRGDPLRIKANFHQSTLAGESLSTEKLRKRAAGHVPQLNEDGYIDETILQLMDEGLPLGEISRRIAASHAGRFRDWQQALARVGELSIRYSR